MNWSSSHYIWNIGIAQIADIGQHKFKTPESYFSEAERVFEKKHYSNIKAGDIVWINCQLLYKFVEEVLPELNVPIVIIISDGDNSFPSDCGVNQEGIKFIDFDVDKFLNNPNIIHIFAQNCDYEGKFIDKVTPIPIGIDMHTISYRRGGWGELQLTPAQQDNLINNILSHIKPTNERKKKAFVDFYHSDTMHGGFRRFEQHGEDRKSIFEFLKTTDCIEYGDFMKRSDLWRQKGEYAFSISPHGNGLDCHRTWEDLVLGCIVIVKTSPLDRLYEGLPVVIIKDWSEINTENLEKWIYYYTPMIQKGSYREKLTCQYWVDKIKGIANQYR